MKKWTLAICFVALIPTACGPNVYKELLKPSFMNSISWERTACFGTCPMYFADIDLVSGAGTFIGKRFTELEGKHTFVLSAEECMAIRNKLKDIGYLDLENEYDSPITDLPSCITTLKHKGVVVKTVRNRVNGPNELIELELILDGYLKKYLGIVF